VIHSGFSLHPGAGRREGKCASNTAHTSCQTYANRLRLQSVGGK
jgi:hypothetical protein